MWDLKCGYVNIGDHLPLLCSKLVCIMVLTSLSSNANTKFSVNRLGDFCKYLGDMVSVKSSPNEWSIFGLK